MKQSGSNVKAFKELKRNLMLVGFLRGMIFWYGIEKLFQLDLGFSIESIIVIGIIAQFSKIFFELPTSVYADRWSRKNTLIVANLAMLLCSLIMGLSTNIAMFVVGALFWSLADALNSGVYSAFAYDSLVHIERKDDFRKVYTRMLNAEFIAIGITGMLAGLLSEVLNLRVIYFITIVPMILVMKLLMSMQEPPIKRTTDDNISWIHHIGGAFTLMRKVGVKWPIGIFMMVIGFQTLWYENYQLLGIEVGVPKLLFGFQILVATLGLIIGAELAHRFMGTRRAILTSWLVITLSHLVGLRLHNPWLFLVNTLLIFVGLRLLFVYLEVYLHDHISSERRATIVSLASTLGYGIFFVLAVGFALLQKKLGVVAAITWVSLPLLSLGLIDMVIGLPWAMKRKTSSYS